MKLLLTFLLASLLTTISTGQIANSIFSDINSSPFAPKFALSKGEILHLADTTVIINSRTPIRLIRQSADTLFVESTSLLNSLGKLDSKQILYILIGDDHQTRLAFSDWDAQILTIPIKIRPAINNAPLEFVGEVSLGSYIGYQLGSSTIGAAAKSTLAHTFMVFAAPSLVRVDPEQAATDMTNNTLGFSLGTGYLFNLNQYQIGIVGGLDYISGQLSKSWIYQGKPWVSFTIGIAFNDNQSQ